MVGDHSVGQHSHAVGYCKDFGNIVAHDHAGEAVAALHGGDELMDALPQQGIEAGGGFVEQHDPRVRHQRPGESGAFLHAAAHLRRILVAHVLEPHLIEPFPHLAADGVLPEACPFAQREGHVVEDGHGIQQRGALEQKAEPFPDLVQGFLPQPGDVRSVHQDLSAVGKQQGDHGLQQHGLAGAAAADDGGDPALLDGQVGALEHRLVVEVLVDVDDFNHGRLRTNRDTTLVWCLTNTLTNLRGLLAVGCVALPRVVHATARHRALPTTKMPSQLHKRICETPH